MESNTLKLVFHHVYKTGGTTVIENMRWCLGDQKFLDLAAFVRHNTLDLTEQITSFSSNIALLKNLSNSAIFVHDPFILSSRELFPEFRFFTIAREPGDRLLSEMNHIYRDLLLFKRDVPEHSDLWDALMMVEDDDLESAQNILLDYELRFNQDKELTEGKLKVEHIDFGLLTSLTDKMPRNWEFRYDEIIESKDITTFVKAFLSKIFGHLIVVNDYNVMRQKKFTTRRGIIVPPNEIKHWLNLKMQKRARETERDLKVENPNYSLIERKKYFNLGDLYPVEGNVVGLASWISQEVCSWLPYSTEEIVYCLIEGKQTYKITVANSANEQKLTELKMFILEESFEKSIVLEIPKTNDFSKTPFSISFDFTSLRERLISGKNKLHLFFHHDPIPLSDGRLTSIQIADGHFH